MLNPFSSHSISDVCLFFSLLKWQLKLSNLAKEIIHMWYRLSIVWMCKHWLLDLCRTESRVITLDICFWSAVEIIFVPFVLSSKIFLCCPHESHKSISDKGFPHFSLPFFIFFPRSCAKITERCSLRNSGKAWITDQALSSRWAGR